MGIWSKDRRNLHDTLSSYQVYWRASVGASEVLVDQPPSGLTRNSWAAKTESPVVIGTQSLRWP